MKNILIVDDELDLLELLKSAFLGTQKYKVSVASNAEDAELLLLETPYDLLLTDIYLPGKNGISLLNSARKLQKDMFVIMMTGFSSQKMKLDSIKSGAVRFFEKPIDIFQLLDCVNSLFSDQQKFSGYVKDISLIDMIQMLLFTHDKKRIQICIGEDEFNSEIYIDHGHIVHAVYLDVTGERAFKEIINSNYYSFEISSVNEFPGRSIYTNTHALLLNSLVEKDEDEENDTNLPETKRVALKHEEQIRAIFNSQEEVCTLIETKSEEIYLMTGDQSRIKNERSVVESILNYFKERRIHRVLEQLELTHTKDPKMKSILLNIDDFYIEARKLNRFICVIISKTTEKNKALFNSLSELL